MFDNPIRYQMQQHTSDIYEYQSVLCLWLWKVSVCVKVPHLCFNEFVFHLHFVYLLFSLFFLMFSRKFTYISSTNACNLQRTPGWWSFDEKFNYCLTLTHVSVFMQNIMHLKFSAYKLIKHGWWWCLKVFWGDLCWERQINKVGVWMIPLFFCVCVNDDKYTHTQTLTHLEEWKQFCEIIIMLLLFVVVGRAIDDGKLNTYLWCRKNAFKMCLQDKYIVWSAFDIIHYLT